MPLNDGSLPYGSKELTINSITYIGENVSLDQGATEIERDDELSVPTGGVVIAGRITGSATLQLESASTVPPAVEGTFDEDLLVAGSAQTWIITGRSPVYAQGDSHKVDIRFKKKIN